MVTFQEFGLKEELVQAVQALGFTTPSPIQLQTIPLLVTEQTDMIALAQTGTGKTAAFGLPLLHKIDLDSNDGVRALVLSPTRELCMQLHAEFEKYSKYLPQVNSVAVYGGTPIGAQIREIRRKNPQVIVATPGRLMDLLEKGVINLEDVKTVVLDEADEMLNMGFRDDINTILKESPEREETWLFSATMNNDVRRIAKKYMNNPKEVAVSRENAGNENIDHQYFVTNAHQRFDALRRLLDVVPDIYGIVFTRTKQDAQDVSEKLMREGYHVSPLHGDMDQNMRTKVMERFKKKLLQVIVATDVAARGIDVNDISHVINYELPEDPEIYTHRSGRTGRAGKSGICMSLVTNREIGRIRQVERIAKTKFTKCDIPDGSEVVRKKLYHFLDKIEEAVPKNDFVDVYEKTISERFEDMGKEELIKRLLWLQLKDTMANYATAPDLNVSVRGKDRERTSSNRGAFARIFMNVGTKDSADPASLVQFISDVTDLENHMISRVTVRELSSFFNVPSEALEHVLSGLSSQRFNGRKVRVEEADNKPNFKDRPYKSRDGGNRDNYRKGGNFEKKDFGRENPKFTKARKQPK